MITKNTPKKVKKALINYVGEEITNCETAIFAGGFFRSVFTDEKISDLDVFFENNDHMIIFKNMIEKNSWIKVFESNKAISYKKDDKKVQLVTFKYTPVTLLLYDFDFTITKYAVCGKLAYYHDNYFEDLMLKHIVYCKSACPLSSLKRAFKYRAKGYEIDDSNIICLAKDIAQIVPFNDSAKLDEHIQGMDPTEEMLKNGN